MAETLTVRKSGSRQRIGRATIVKVVGGLLVVFVIIPLAYLYFLLSGSKPTLDGAVSVPGLGGAVTIARDSLGVPTITAASRPDLAYGTGFLHAQDRFFQMDLSRRLAAGELSELFGPIAVEQDRSTRLFRFRAIAAQVLSQATPDQRAVVEAYARGVNAGLSALRSRPWEYFVLQVTPAPWLPEDVVLVSFAMWWDLQHDNLSREKVKRAINEKLGGAVCANGWKCAMEFFYPRGTSWDSPNSGAPALDAPQAIHIPTPEELNVRAQGSLVSARPGAARSALTAISTGPLRVGGLPGNSGGGDLRFVPDRHTAGSNGWVVSGSLTEGGGALVASDMHLGLRVPVVWYRARLQLTVPGASEPTLDLNGLTLPGAPVLVVGSNTRIAWGYTNSYGDWVDLTLERCNAVDDTSVRTPTGTIPLTTVQEKILVKKGQEATLSVRSGPSGVLYEADPASGRCWFARWLATVPDATNFNIMSLETAATVEEAIELAPTVGIPHQNLMVGDREGHIGWTILGRIPDTDDAESRLSGTPPWTTAANHPRLIDPPNRRLWTANARPIDDPGAQSAIGGDEASLGAEYDLSARAQQIRNGLLAINPPAKPADMLAVQLDDRALFLTRWHDKLLGLLDAEALRDQPQRAELKRLVEGWNARATPDAVGYRLVHAWRRHTELAVWQTTLSALDLEAADAPAPPQFEGALWALVTQQPAHLLPAGYENWRAFLLDQVDATIEQLTTANEAGPAACPQLDRCTWGSRRPVLFRHPMAGAIPFAARFLNMPQMQLSGDHDMPRVQDGAFGASERFAVVPGREAEGYLHMPGGQSGHPLSPFYRAGFAEWAEGKPLPFLPGQTEHTLTLQPAAAAP